MKTFWTTLFVGLLVMISPAWGQGRKSANPKELAAYTGADREKVLFEGAKAEGKVVWYTSLAGGSFKAMVKGFETKYPGVKVEVYRAGSKDLAAKILAETQAQRFLADAIESTPPILMVLRDNGVLMPYGSLHLAKYPDDSKIKADKGLIYWVTDRESYLGLGYNKNSIAANAVPKSYEDLLRPELKGKIALTTDSTGERVLGTMLKLKGEEFIRKLKGQEVKLLAISGRALLDIVIAGEVAASPSIFRNHALVAIEKGAPVAWVPMDVAPTNAGGSALMAKAPHPHAALLLVDFIIGPDGQKILEGFKYGVATKDYGFKRVYPESGLTTAQYEKESTKWSKLLRSIGRK